MIAVRQATRHMDLAKSIQDLRIQELPTSNKVSSQDLLRAEW